MLNLTHLTKLEVYTIYPKRRLDLETLEYVSAWFYKKIRLESKNEKVTLLTVFKDGKAWKIFVNQAWRNFVSKEPTDDWVTFELCLTREACNRVGIEFEADKEKRIEDLDEFVKQLEKEGKIWVIFGSENFAEQHV